VLHVPVQMGDVRRHKIILVRAIEGPTSSEGDESGSPGVQRSS
jgi:hypothetical protein